MKLIDKDALVADIERLDALYHTSKDLSGDLFIQGLFCFLDTSEVKEVDLEKEMSEYFVEHSDEFFSDKYKLFAKHFFELGLKAQKRENV